MIDHKSITKECYSILERQAVILEKEHQEDSSDLFIDLKILVKGGSLIDSLMKEIIGNSTCNKDEMGKFLELITLKALKKYGHDSTKNMLLSVVISQAFTYEFLLSALQDLNSKHFQGIHNLKTESQSVILSGSLEFVKNAILCGIKDEEIDIRESLALVQMAITILDLIDLEKKDEK